MIISIIVLKVSSLYSSLLWWFLERYTEVVSGGYATHPSLSISMLVPFDERISQVITSKPNYQLKEAKKVLQRWVVWECPLSCNCSGLGMLVSSVSATLNLVLCVATGIIYLEKVLLA